MSTQDKLTYLANRNIKKKKNYIKKSSLLYWELKKQKAGIK